MAATTRGIGGRPQIAAVVRQQPLLQRSLRHVDVAGEPELVAFVHQLLLACGMHASGVAVEGRGWNPLSTGKLRCERRQTEAQPGEHPLTQVPPMPNQPKGCQPLGRAPWRGSKEGKERMSCVCVCVCVCVCDSIDYS